jgi:SAM-dependent methyltransferase
MRRLLNPRTIKSINPSLVLPERGFPLQTRRRWATHYEPLTGKTILVQGTGTGWDVITWAELKPVKIIATDLFNFEDSWNEIREYCLEHFGVEVYFYQAPLEDHSFIDSECIDLCASDTVYEHCTNLHKVMLETNRILKRNGYVYATYGPMWFCAWGNHFSRGGSENAFNHLILDEQSYKLYYKKYLNQEEDFQSGGRYIELGLFSYLTTSEYLEIYRKTGFVVDDLILELSSQALSYAKKFPEQFASMADKLKNRCNRDDFIIKANLVRLKKV